MNPIAKHTGALIQSRTPTQDHYSLRTPESFALTEESEQIDAGYSQRLLGGGRRSIQPGITDRNTGRWLIFHDRRNEEKIHQENYLRLEIDRGRVSDYKNATAGPLLLERNHQLDFHLRAVLIYLGRCLRGFSSK